ncbi:glycoside hydrolase family 35 protein [Sphaerobolus stellatus SS14]|uniref:beta-galactosidase n=1 Tax=Sphaerobolus stellatus (strain SS14) TaxID=990650 RepID=A0A0C9U594_SPHS4|nr:glycoside hydrolase family 35 protein [Sphaerobolus stellatus SS14]
MDRLRSLLFLLPLLQLSAAQSTTAPAVPAYTPPPGSPGFYHGNSSAAVTFDQQSLFLDNKRLFVFSGEFHPWRLPSGPEAWRDVLEKMKAAGFNSVSVYHHWGVTEPKQGDLNFGNFRSQGDFYQVAKEVGILVMARPGPYINAETTAGGFPGWTTNLAAKARTNATEWTNAWTPYLSNSAKAATPFQYPAGPIITVQAENEFVVSTPSDPGRSEAMVLVENNLRNNGITKVPITHNDPGTNGRYAHGLGMVDWYMWDGYPNGFLCASPSQWSEVRSDLIQEHMSIDPAEPWAAGEFQGGSFDPWGGSGYQQCYQLTGEEFANVFYKNNYASGIVYQNLYMTFGGTNWGNLPEPTVYTSYDYGAPIKEDRTLTPKYSEIKLQSHFLHASPDILVSTPVAAGTNFTNNANVYTTLLSGAPSGANFYVVRQTTNTNTSPVSFKLNINTAQGALTVPQFGSNITLAGRESKILVSNYQFGSSQLLYSTAEVNLTWFTMEKTDTIVLYALPGQQIEVVLPNITSNALSTQGSSSVTAKISNKSLIITGSPSGTTFIKAGSTSIIVADKFTARTFWNPKVDTKTTPYDVAPDVASVLVSGPYLVRNASISGPVLALRGDLNETTTLEVLAPASIKGVTWNGAPVVALPTAQGTLKCVLPFTLKKPTLPSLKSLQWACTDSLPEVQPGFDDSTWVVANKTTTNRPPQYQPFSGKFLLYADEYGFHQGNTLYRGHFKGANATGVKLAVEGGFNFGYSAWINSHFLFSNNGTNQYSANGGTNQVNDTLTFPAGSLTSGDNILTVVLDPTGLEEDFDGQDEHKTPRGIRGYELLGGGDFDSWKIIGNFGGESAPDKVRAHLPGFSTKGWSSGASCNPLTTGLSAAGIKAFRTSFNLNLPVGSDIPVALNFTRIPSSRHRSAIFINGWQFGRFSSADGPQTLFPLPDGILNSRGNNELLITLWSLDAPGAEFADVELVSTAVVQSSKRRFQEVS